LPPTPTVIASFTAAAGLRFNHPFQPLKARQS
jgi:hypothetical protein